MTTASAPARETTERRGRSDAPRPARRRASAPTREKSRVARCVFLGFVVAIDCLIVFDAFSMAYLLRFVFQLAPFYWPPEPPEQYLEAMVVVAYFWLLLFKAAGLYDFSKTRSDLDTVHLVARSIGFGTLVILSISYFYRGFSFSRLVCVYAWAIALVLFSAFRLAVSRVRAQVFREGVGVRRVLLIGSRSIARFLAGRIAARPELGYRVVGALDDERPEDTDAADAIEVEGAAAEPVPWLGSVEELDATLAETGAERVFIAHSALGHLQQLEVIETCERRGVAASIVPPTFDLLINPRDFEEIDGIPLVSVRERDYRGAYDVAKRAIDIVVASAGIVLLAPLGLLLGALIRRHDGGPALFSQVRIGRDGRPFRMWKFRTMVLDAEDRLRELVDLDALEQPVFKIENDPRVTPTGRFLRRTSLDELPQLWNVLRGEMSLVGPRPEEESVVARYGVQERRRLKATPGITGLQQVECRGSDDLRERVRLDILWLRKRSLLLDLWIALRTVWVVAAGRGTH